MFEFYPIVDTLDAVPEPFRPMYGAGAEGSTNAGKFIIHADFSNHVKGLTSALDKERKANSSVKAQVEAWAKLGENPEAVTARITDLETAAAAGKSGQANWDKMKADLVAGHQRELLKHVDQVGAMQKSLERYLVDAEATTAITETKGSAVLLLPHIRAAVKVINENGNYITRVVDRDGDPRGDGKGGFMTIKELVAEMRQSEQYGRAFEASGTTGSGTRPGNRTGGTGNGDRSKDNKGSDLSPVDKIKAGLAARAARH